MYSGDFYPYKTLEEHWAYWSRYIYINRYTDVPKPVYNQIYNLVKDKDYFVLTTNVDHCFQKAGFDKHRLFYTQGDYGLFQCSKPCHNETYDNEEIIRKMVLSQGYKIINGELIQPESVELRQAFYICLNQSEAYAPVEIAGKSICMDTDISVLLEERRAKAFNLI